MSGKRAKKVRKQVFEDTDGFRDSVRDMLHMKNKEKHEYMKMFYDKFRAKIRKAMRI